MGRIAPRQGYATAEKALHRQIVARQFSYLVPGAKQVMCLPSSEGEEPIVLRRYLPSAHIHMVDRSEAVLAWARRRSGLTKLAATSHTGDLVDVCAKLTGQGVALDVIHADLCGTTTAAEDMRGESIVLDGGEILYPLQVAGPIGDVCNAIRAATLAPFAVVGINMLRGREGKATVGLLKGDAVASSEWAFSAQLAGPPPTPLDQARLDLAWHCLDGTAGETDREVFLSGWGSYVSSNNQSFLFSIWVLLSRRPEDAAVVRKRLLYAKPNATLNRLAGKPSLGFMNAISLKH
jgi:hypothetical protein